MLAARTIFTPDACAAALMGKYILKRILFFIPTLIVISLLAFVISINAPGDPLDRMVSAIDSGGETGQQSLNTQKEKERWRKKLGLDLPVFYFSVSNKATPDTLYKVYDDGKRNGLKRLISQYGNWELISDYNRKLSALFDAHRLVQIDSSLIDSTDTGAWKDTLSESRFAVIALLSAWDERIIRTRFEQLNRMYDQLPQFADLQEKLSAVTTAYTAMTEQPSKYKNYIPVIRFHPYNQYHRWIFGDGNWLTGKGSTDSRGLIRGDFGYSYETKLPVSGVIAERIRWSLLFTIVSITLAYLISLPIGIRAAAKKNSLFDRSSSVILFMLYSLPAFWVATLLLMTFANPNALAWFPASGIQPMTGIPEDAGFFERMRLRIPYLILPTICYTYAQLAFLSRITRVSTLEIISQDYIRTAYAKGLSGRSVIYKHAFRNALLPIITVFSNIFPLALSGSVILETIFTIPGMGLQIFQAIMAKDYPVIIDVFTLTGILTLVGYLFADLMYAIADPRITYHAK
jgi:peptide/nickel transport system permease protein